MCIYYTSCPAFILLFVCVINRRLNLLLLNTGGSTCVESSIKLRGWAEILIVLLKRAHKVVSEGVLWLNLISHLSIFLMLILFMYRQLATLSKCFRAPIYPTYIRFLPSMCVLMFLKILWEHKTFFTMFTCILLIVKVFHIVSFERELAREKFLTVLYITLVELLPHY